MRYAVVIEKAESNYSAYVPDLPGCVATGETVEEVEAQIRARAPHSPAQLGNASQAASDKSEVRKCM